ncbi:MAG: tRNA (adenosine(37)-N6)-threonylcarbamoyltransferase complex dimerization subunit type 1 TsaB [Panacagrimonas sp.]
MKRILAIDSSTQACSVALSVDGQLLEHFEIVGQSHIQRLLPMMNALMAEAGVSARQLDGLVCGVGPGSFVGVRIAVGLVKGMAMSLDRPVYPVSSLAMLARRALQSGEHRILAAIDARMGEIYFQAFVRSRTGTLQAQSDPVLVTPERLPQPQGHHWFACGSAWAAYSDALTARLDAQVHGVDADALPHAQTALAVAHDGARNWQDASALTPLYVRDKVALNLREQALLRAKKAAQP